MNTHTPLPPDDDDFAREERELAELYRRLPQAEPDAALDARILAEARRAVTAPSRRRATRWQVGIGTAAILVLAVGVTWRLQPLPRVQTAPRVQTEPQPESSMETRGQAATVEAVATPSTARAKVDNSAHPAPRPASPAPAAQMRQRMAQEKAEAQPAPADRSAESAGVEADLMRESRPPGAAAYAPPPPAPPPTQPATMPKAQPAAKGTTVPAEAERADRSSRPKPDAAALVAAARKSLRKGNTKSARESVRTLLRDYPRFILPADLAPLNAGNAPQH